MSLDLSGTLIYLNGGDDRILALEFHGYVVRDSGADHVVAFDFRTGSFAGPVVQLVRLNGQALVLVP
jgi:hypothetical protein